MSNPDAEPGSDSALSSQAQDVSIGGNFQVDGEGNRVDFSQTTIDQSHAQISHTHIVQVAFDEVKARPLNPRSPYIGLRKFEVRDRDLFFGRDRILAHLQERLQEHFLLVLGASGSGKSSLIRAGLISQLVQQRGGEFRELICTPDRNPFESFRASLTSAGYRQSDTEFLLTGQPDSLLKAAQTVKANDDEWLIFIDQFEELFTLCPNGLIRQHFIDSLVSLVRSGLPSVDLVVAMRADFLDRLSAYPSLGGILQRSELITDLGDDELRLAIEQPAARHGVVFEPGLVGEIIQGLKGRNETGEAERISLPLLQYTLKLLWESSGDLGDRILRTSTYRQIGGVRGALQRRVDEIYNGLSGDEQQAAKHIFLQLVDTTTADVGTTAVGKAVSRRANLTEFRDPAEQKVLEQLINASLLVSDRSSPDSSAMVELAHETLIDSWDTLKRWIEESKPLIRLRNQLKDDATRWYDLHQQNSTQADAELWQGYKLQWLLERRQDVESQFGNFSSTEIDFISFSKELRDRQQNKEIERQRKQKWMAVTTAIAFMGALNVGIVALWMWQTTERHAIDASVKAASALFTQNQSSLDPLLSALEAEKRLQRIPAFLRSPELEADVMSVLAQAVYRVHEHNIVEGHSDWVYGVEFSPDGKLLASASLDGTVKLWQPDGILINTLQGLDGGALVDVSFSPDGQTLAAGGKDAAIYLWSQDGDLLRTLKGHDNWVTFVQFSPDGQRLASASVDGTVKLWREDGTPLATLAGHDEPVMAVSFNPVDETLVSGSLDGTIRIWQTNGTLLKTIVTKDGIFDVTFSPDGAAIAAASQDGSLTLWSSEGNFLKAFQPISNGDLISVDFSPDGQFIAAAGEDRIIRIWRQDGTLVTTLSGHQDAVQQVNFSPDGNWIASASEDLSLRLWQWNNPWLESLQGHSQRVNGVAVNPQTSQIISGSQDGTVKLWSMEGQATQSLATEVEWINGVAVSPDGRWIAAVGQESAASQVGLIQLWSAAGEARGVIGRQGQWVNAVAFSPDSQSIASASNDGLIQIRGLDGQITQTFEIGANAFAVGFSPDGQFLAAGGEGGLKVWRLAGGELLHAYNSPATVYGLSFSPDSQNLVFANSDRTIGLWPLNKPAPRFLEKSHDGEVYAVQFSPDGRQFASGGQDNMLRLWSSDGEAIATIGNHDASIETLQFSADGSKIITGSDDNTLIIWDLSILNPETLVSWSCDWLTGYLQNNPNVADSDRTLCQGVVPWRPETIGPALQ